MTTLAPPTPAKDRATLALGMTLCAVLFGLAINVRQGLYSPGAMIWLTIGLIVSLVTVAFSFGGAVEAFVNHWFTPILTTTTLISACTLLYQTRLDPEVCFQVLVVAALGLMQATNLRAMRVPLLVAMVIAFCLVASIIFISPGRAKNPNIDVFLFQQDGAKALSEGQDPYAIRFPNIYGTSVPFQNPLRFGPGTPFYGPGVVDDNGWITYGFPYPPLSLLMVLPAYVLGGDCRFAHTIAMGLSALMMALARPGRRGALVALLFLVTPQGLFVILNSWTEPLLVFTFSLAMFCACRWRKGLPWALGLFFATKQYTVLAVPALLLLLDGPNPIKQLLDMVVKAGAVLLAVTMPFIAWNPHEFFRAVVQWQLVQPFRMDALSYLVWHYNPDGHLSVSQPPAHPPPLWVPLLAVFPAIGLALWRCVRSPAGFAAAVTLIYLAFFAFNKQAFCNYYYFVIGTACWSVAAVRPQPVSRAAAAPASATPVHVPLPSGR